MRKVYLFDVDGTLCRSGERITDDMLDVLRRLKQTGCELGIVGGGTYEKLRNQIGDVRLFKYVFAECGSVVYVDNRLVHTNDIRQHRLYDHINRLVKMSLRFISEQDYPVTGHFIDLRNGLVYVSLVGMQASLDERRTFIELDRVHQYRKRLYEKLVGEAVRVPGLTVSYGGEVGLSIYPSEWDKVQVLRYFEAPDEVHYFGDKYQPGGNDHEIVNSPRVTGHRVDSPVDTAAVLSHLL